MALKSILHGQITQKIKFEVGPEMLLKSILTPSDPIRQNPKPVFERLFLTHFENGIKKHSTWADY